MNRKKRRAAGAISIEAVLSLTIFMMTILALLMGTMLIRAQAAMQYALNQTAKEISGYFYLLDKFGVASIISGKETDSAAANIQQLNDSIGHIVSFSADVKDDANNIKEEFKEDFENLKKGDLTPDDIERIKNIGADEKDKLEEEFEIIKNDLKELKSADKKLMLKGILQVFTRAMINTGLSKYVTPWVCKALMPKYLSVKDEESFYNAAGIDPESIRFDGSKILEDGRTISLVVHYDVDASKLTLGFYKKKLHFRQVASTCAWVRANASGSIVSLSDVDDYFDPDNMEKRRQYLEELRKKEQAEKEAKEKEKAAQEKDFAEKMKAINSTKVSDAVKSLSTDEQTAFYKVAKTDPELVKKINSSKDPAAAVKFIAQFGEDGSKLYKSNGDMAVSSMNLLDEDSQKRFFEKFDPESWEAHEVLHYLDIGDEESFTDKEYNYFLYKKDDPQEEIVRGTPVSTEAKEEKPETVTTTAKVTKRSADSDIYETKNGRKVLQAKQTYYISGKDGKRSDGKDHSVYEYHTDDQGRIKSVSGTLEDYKAKRQKYAQSHVGREDRITADKLTDDQKKNQEKPDEGGHLIASRFNGNGGWANLVPMSGDLNHNEWYDMEEDWATLLRQGYEVNVEISIKYPEGSQRPEAFNVTTTVIQRDKEGKMVGKPRVIDSHFDNCKDQTDPYQRIIMPDLPKEEEQEQSEEQPIQVEEQPVQQEEQQMAMQPG